MIEPRIPTKVEQDQVNNMIGSNVLAHHNFSVGRDVEECGDEVANMIVH